MSSHTKNYCNKFETSIMTSILFDVEWFENTETKIVNEEDMNQKEQIE